MGCCRGTFDGVVSQAGKPNTWEQSGEYQFLSLGAGRGTAALDQGTAGEKAQRKGKRPKHPRKAGSHGMNVVTPPNSSVEILTPQVSEARALGSLLNGSSVLREETPESSLPLSTR